MPQRRHSERYVRSASRRRPSVPPPNKGARCVTRQRVYSRVLRRHVLRCRRFEGGRVGIRQAPKRLPNGLRCARRKKVYSLFYRKKVLRCAKYGQQPRFVAHAASTPMVSSGPSPMMIAWITSLPPASKYTEQSPVPSWFEPEPEQQQPMLLLPPNAASLVNRNRMFRRLHRQMGKMQKARPQTSSRWPKRRS